MPDASTMAEGVARRCDTLRKPELDERSYRWLALHNKLEVLLISDSQADKAAAAMDVAVGHASDPEELPGLAHFCEHMLFLGTEKYPDEGSYQQFLSEHGGSSNAFTAFENTNFYFDVTQPHLHDALDRFAQFFLCPCFTEGATSRELKAVDSENAKNLQSDSWRLMQLYKSTANPAHPFHKFGTGNLSTLRDRPEDVVRLELRATPGGEVALTLAPEHRAPVSVREPLTRVLALALALTLFLSPSLSQKPSPKPSPKSDPNPNLTLTLALALSLSLAPAQARPR